jgi:uncharacterized protein YndB with AHSA1/START domain
MADESGGVIRIAARMAAPAERVWAAWTDPARIAEWFVDAASGEVVVGGTFTWVWEKFGYVVPQRVVELEAGRKLVLETEARGRAQRLEIRIVQDTGETILRLVHSGFGRGVGWEEEYGCTKSGWVLATRRWAEPRSEVLVLRPARFEYADLVPLYRTEAGLARWLTRSGAPGGAGKRHALELRDGSRMSGSTLAESAWESALEWDEARGVLELKAFAAGPGTRMLGVRFSGWSLGAEAAAQVERALVPAVDRLVTEVGG